MLGPRLLSVQPRSRLCETSTVPCPTETAVRFVTESVVESAARGTITEMETVMVTNCAESNKDTHDDNEYGKRDIGKSDHGSKQRPTMSAIMQALSQAEDQIGEGHTEWAPNCSLPPHSIGTIMHCHTGHAPHSAPEQTDVGEHDLRDTKLPCLLLPPPPSPFLACPALNTGST